MTLAITWLWQGTAIAGIVMILLRTMPRVSAAARHTIWWLALAAVLALPATYLLPLPSDAPPGTGFASQNMGVLLVPAMPASIINVAVLLWALWAACGVTRVARSCMAVARLKRDSVKFDAVREAQLRMWTAIRASGWRRPELRISGDSRTGACALGLGRPAVILVSSSLADSLDNDELDEIVMHEVAHLVRCDDWLRLLQTVILSIAGLHPGIRVIAREIDVEREAACDDRVVAHTGSARHYARSLAAAAAASQGGWPGLAPGAARSASMLRQRINRLIDPELDRGSRCSGAACLTTVVALVVTLIVAPRLTPVIAFVEPTEMVVALPTAPVYSAGIELTEPRPPAMSEQYAVELTPVVRHTPITVQDREVEASVEPPLTVLNVESATAQPFLGGRAALAILVPPAWPQAINGTSPTGESSRDIPLWSSVARSATATTMDAARTAVSTGARAKSAGVSIGRIASRVGSAFATGF